jgi:hypothetical protein
LREKTSEEKQGIVPPGFSSPTLILPTTAVAAEGVTVPILDGAKIEKDTTEHGVNKDQEMATNEEGKEAMEVEVPANQELRKDESNTEESKEEMAVEI